VKIPSYWINLETANKSKQHMNQFFSLLLLIACFATSCNSDNKVSATSTDEEGNKTTTTMEVSDPKEVANQVDDMEKRMEELKKLMPYNLEQLKVLLPQDLNGIKRKNFNAQNALGYAVIQGEYPKDDTTVLQVSIYDCAGEAGASWYGVNYWSKMNFQNETDDGYTKTIDFQGGKAVESYDNNSRQSTLSYVANDRLLITLTGKNMSPDELKAAAGKFNFKI
jgi:hypothetical protein